ncbi:putative protein-L-isoaspartate O-methyltransferase [Ancylostoma ceylanicum]|uniref:protein-L-isoaspartate(D-aspartate) O-methyltransferase n=1 Tax=Ancylostoma ceylanicum TaxID=53326 RepID=A0A0D6LQZ9_9BILA|nr:putative protein-L-isoaspartate O-methyltransferase [Ancylostoma ceylanicum]
MLATDRGDFAPRSPYMDQPQGIGWNATISAPHMHAAALEYLKNHLTEGAYALDVGSGSGYLTVCMALMTGSTGKVVGIEHIPQLVELAKENTMKHHADLIDSGRILFVEGDGRKGYPMEQKYDAIHVGAAAETVPQPTLETAVKPTNRTWCSSSIVTQPALHENRHFHMLPRTKEVYLSESV